MNTPEEQSSIAPSAEEIVKRMAAALEEKKCEICHKLSASPDPLISGITPIGITALSVSIPGYLLKAANIPLYEATAALALLTSSSIGALIYAGGSLVKHKRLSDFKKAEEELTGMGAGNICERCPHYPHVKDSLPPSLNNG
ncbi:MAG: hypothetical protein PHX43_04015 [Alphaproteobacteria bacterium]|nr:hypothetical protein [Alphaproteobacteria bacterium]